jgi:hypothetical protein
VRRVPAAGSAAAGLGMCSSSRSGSSCSTEQQLCCRAAAAAASPAAASPAAASPAAASPAAASLQPAGAGGGATHLRMQSSARSTASWLLSTAQMPSLASSRNWSPCARSVTSTSGSGMTPKRCSGRGAGASGPGRRPAAAAGGGRAARRARGRAGGRGRRAASSQPGAQQGTRACTPAGSGRQWRGSLRAHPSHGTRSARARGRRRARRGAARGGGAAALRQAGALLWAAGAGWGPGGAGLGAARQGLLWGAAWRVGCAGAAALCEPGPAAHMNPRWRQPGSRWAAVGQLWPDQLQASSGLVKRSGRERAWPGQARSASSCSGVPAALCWPCCCPVLCIAPGWPSRAEAE